MKRLIIKQITKQPHVIVTLLHYKCLLRQCKIICQGAFNNYAVPIMDNSKLYMWPADILMAFYIVNSDGKG